MEIRNRVSESKLCLEMILYMLVLSQKSRAASQDAEIRSRVIISLMACPMCISAFGYVLMSVLVCIW